ncbi:MAG: RagB/SusD family nutrient uptake outer membrane protein [Bacteroidales bacterium]|nr:RagB/SusD family nutrient uptake outer membrane protein [Bacteroidales bacterium]
MKKLILNLAIAAGLVTGLASCEGFLDKVPTDSVVSESAMVTMDDAKVAVNGLYTDLKTTSMYGSNMVYFGDMRGDNIYPRQLSGTGDAIYRFNFAAGQNNYFGMWQNYYYIIMKASTYINNVNTIVTNTPAEEARRDDDMGQAYAVRALCYFDLARLYGYPYLKDNGSSLGAIVLDHDNDKAGIVSPEEAKTLSRNTVAETFAQALKDVEKALTVLSKEKNNGHFNYWAAKMLQGKIALYKGDYQLAFSANSEVVESSPYRMVPNDEYLEYWGVECDDESVLELLVSPDGDIDSDGGSGSIYNSFWFGDKTAARSIVLTKKWVELFGDFKTSTDIRAKMIQENDPNVSQVKEEFHWLKKFIGNKAHDRLTFRQNNPRIFRITDAYLMAAEAALQTGNQAKADEYLNAVRKRADLNAENVTATQELVMIERHKEFIGEGHRFFDVMRTGGEIVRDMSIDVRDYDGDPRKVINWNTYTIVLPIAENEFSVHPAIQQNPGY